MAVNCPRCHSEILDDSRYCGKCGAPIYDAQKAQAAFTKTLVAPSPGVALGSVVAGKYRVIEEIGRGGMGIVYKAQDTKLDRTVALKFLPPEWTFDLQAKERFAREARAAAALDNPHICAVYEIDEAEGRMFISMAFVEGETLRRKIEQGPLKLEDAVAIGIQVASGLKDAHLKGIVHRDIKSSNIMISGQGQAKVLDFGLAKIRGGVLVTKEGATMGTVAYMSPEQARGEAVDHRTDIWSLGVVIYQALTGHLPFEGEHDQVVLHSILHNKPKPLRSLHARIPLPLERIVDRALEKNREARYQSADELLSDLLGVRKELEAGSYEEGLSWPRLLVKRRVPQVLGLYVLGSLGILQLVKWLVDRFVLSPHLPGFSMVTLLSLIPTVFLLAWFQGGRARKKWVKVEKIGILVNLAFSAAVLVLLFNGKSLGAATTTVTMRNEEGQTVQRIIPKSGFAKRVAVFFFDNNSKDASQDWLQYGIPLLIHVDLFQDLFVFPEVGYDVFEKTKAAGFPEGVGLPLTLKSKIARDQHCQFFVSGSFSRDGEEIVLESSTYDAKRAIAVAKNEFRGHDIFELADQMTLQIRRDIGIPEQHIRDQKGLPVSEMVTDSVQALRSFIEGANAEVFDKNWEESLSKFEKAVTEDPTFAYAYNEIQRRAVHMNLREKSEQAFRSLLQHLYKLPERVQYLLKSDYYAFKEDREKQIAVLKMMGELSPNDLASHLALSEIYTKGNQLDEALAEAKRILKIDPGVKDALLEIGSLYERKGKLKEALRYYEQYTAQFPGEVKSVASIGDLYRRQGDFERAESTFKKALLIEPENVAILISLAAIEADLGNFEGSERTLQGALENAKTPQEKIDVYGSLSSVLGTQAQYRKSLEYVRLALEEIRRIQPPFVALLYSVNYLNAFINAGQKDEMLKIVEQIKSQAAPPYDTIVPRVYLAIYMASGDVEKAETALRDVDSIRLSDRFEENKQADIVAHAAILEMSGEYEQAIAAYKKILDDNPNDLGLCASLGRNYRKVKKLKEAEEYLQKSLVKNPFDPYLHNELSLLYIDKKDNKKALEHLKIALDIWKNADAGIPRVEDARKRLLELTGG